MMNFVNIYLYQIEVSLYVVNLIYLIYDTIGGVRASDYEVPPTWLRGDIDKKRFMVERNTKNSRMRYKTFK